MTQSSAAYPTLIENGRRGLSPSTVPIEFVELVMNQVSTTAIYIKSADLRFLSANIAAARMLGASTPSNMIGKETTEFLQADDCRSDEEAERAVISSGVQQTSSIRYWRPTRAPAVWLLVNRWPAPLQHGRGVMVSAQFLADPKRRHQTYLRVAKTVEYISSHLTAPVSISALARRAGTTSRQLTRDFLHTLARTPRQHLIRVRFDLAVRLLSAGHTVADVAHACGYADQSAFARRFKSAIGAAPTEFRRNHAPIALEDWFRDTN